jgi:hypothetical protein
LRVGIASWASRARKPVDPNNIVHGFDPAL